MNSNDTSLAGGGANPSPATENIHGAQVMYASPVSNGHLSDISSRVVVSPPDLQSSCRNEDEHKGVVTIQGADRHERSGKVKDFALQGHLQNQQFNPKLHS